MEIIVDSVQATLNAINGGTKKLAICSNLMEGGLSPTIGMLRVVKSMVDIPVSVMIRPCKGHFVYSNLDVESIIYDLKLYKQNGADAFIVGILTREHYINEKACKALLEAAKPLPCTFNRAFDLVKEPFNQLEILINLGFVRVFTSGQEYKASDGVRVIKALSDVAKQRIGVVPCGGITDDNLKKILKETKCTEFHSSGRNAAQVANIIKPPRSDSSASSSSVYSAFSGYNVGRKRSTEYSHSPPVLCEEQCVKNMNEIFKSIVKK